MRRFRAPAFASSTNKEEGRIAEAGDPADSSRTGTGEKAPKLLGSTCVGVKSTPPVASILQHSGHCWTWKNGTKLSDDRQVINH